MAYTVQEIKIHAYNYAKQPDYTPEEENLFLGLAYCYDWHRLHPEDKAVCTKKAQEYVDWFERAKMKEIEQKGGGCRG